MASPGSNDHEFGSPCPRERDGIEPLPVRGAPGALRPNLVAGELRRERRASVATAEGAKLRATTRRVRHALDGRRLARVRPVRAAPAEAHVSERTDAAVGRRCQARAGPFHRRHADGALRARHRAACDAAVARGVDGRQNARFRQARVCGRPRLRVDGRPVAAARRCKENAREPGGG
jgi:hypothetical protein